MLDARPPLTTGYMAKHAQLLPSPSAQHMRIIMATKSVTTKQTAIGSLGLHTGVSNGEVMVRPMRLHGAPSRLGKLGNPPITSFSDCERGLRGTEAIK